MQTPTAIFLLIFLTTVPSAAATTDTNALLSIKSHLVDPLGALSGWSLATPSPPCDWRGVRCYSNRVHELRLPRLSLAGILPENISGITQLRRLSLHSNRLSGRLPNSITSLSFLRAVYLHNNSFSGELPEGLFGLGSMQILNVANNEFSGSVAGVRVSKGFRVLDLSGNGFSGRLPGSFSGDSEMGILNFSFNKFSGGIPASIGLLRRLQFLWLDGNMITGTIPSAIVNCSMLVHVSADGNMISGEIPASVGAMPELVILSLSRNELSGTIPSSLFSNGSSSVRIVSLGFNAFTGMAAPVARDGVNGALEVLQVGGNRITGALPYWLTNMSSLRVLDVSGNLFSGSLPIGIGNLVSLEELRVGDNWLGGQVPGDIAKCRMLRVLDLEGNGFLGPLPGFIGGLSDLRILSLGRNKFSGSIGWSLDGLSDLEVLNLSENELNGDVPQGLFSLDNLTTLNLSYNNFSGEIARNVGDLKRLMVLNLSSCGLSGSIPTSIGNLMRLTTLDFSKQNLSGEIPSGLFGLPGLQIVALQENRLHGDVPQGLTSLYLLHYLNLSSNGFTGAIPSTYGFLRSLSVLSMSVNQITGIVPVEIGNCSELQVLELGSNHLTGHIPSTLSLLSGLRELDLANNSLDGSIAGSFSMLYNLTVLNLSSNRLNGTIPDGISNLPGLTDLNLSNNDLQGQIPATLGSRFNDSSVFAMNSGLCGEPLKECPAVKRRKRKKLIILVGMAVAGLCLVLLCCCGYIIGLVILYQRLKARANGDKKSSSDHRSSGSRENGTQKLVMFNNRISYAETLDATGQFDEESVICRGKNGLVFKASFPDGMVLAIRQLPDGANLDENGFVRDAESLGKVKHRNITVLRGYYTGPPDVRLLIYDYMPNGNLGTLLQEATHHEGHVLNWPMRHLIALGIARGLAFLHSVAIIHGDIKPQNILFDADFEAHVSEFGLDQFIVSTSTAAKEASTSYTVVGTIGYVAPEVSETGETTSEGDVYSFGIMLLEMLTGKKPVMFDHDDDIVKWVKKQLQEGQINELLNTGLLELDPESSEWEEFLLGLKVGLLCTAADPVDRPSMGDVVFMLEGCRVGPDFQSSADPTAVASPC